MKSSKVGIVVFDDVEVLDFAGPYEVFSITRSSSYRERHGQSAYEVALISQNGGPITTRGGMRVNVDYSFVTCPTLDIVVVPGGWGTRREAENPEMCRWLQHCSHAAQLVTSVCTGSFLLAGAGLLKGRRATTHWMSLDRMRDEFPDTQVDYASHVVRDGRIYTAAGISAGIDMALRVVAEHFDEDVARRTAAYMEYPYPDNNERRVHLEGR